MGDGNILSARQRVFLSNDERFDQIDPNEAKARAQFAPVIEDLQQGGHSVHIGQKGSHAWKPRHSSVKTKLPLVTPSRATINADSAKVARTGRITANVRGGPKK